MNTATLISSALMLGFGLYAARDAVLLTRVKNDDDANPFLAIEAAIWAFISLIVIVLLYALNTTLYESGVNDTTVLIAAQIIMIFQGWTATSALAPYVLVPTILGRRLPVWRSSEYQSMSTEGRWKWVSSAFAVVCLVQIYGGGILHIVFWLRLLGVGTPDE